MSSGNLVELGVGFLQQFFALIADRPDFTVPASWATANQYFRSINFGMDFIRRYVPDLADFRMFFLTISVIIPLFFTYLGLIFVNPLRVIIWYFMAMTGLLLLIVGASAQIFNNIAKSSRVNFQLGEVAAKILMIVGGCVLFVCLVLFGVRKKLLTLCHEAAEISEQNSHLSLEDRMEKEIENISWNATLSRFVTAGSLFVLGGSFVGFLDQGPKLPIEALARGLGWFFIAIAFPIFFYMIVGLFKSGRDKQWKIAQYGEIHFLKLYLLAISLIYIPVGSGLFLVFNCNDFACAAGTRLYDEGSLAPFNRTSTQDICVTCDRTYSNEFCPIDIASSICLGSSQSRLEADLAIKCTDIKPFFWPAAFIVMFFFMLGVPYLFYKMILTSTQILEEKFPDTMNDDGSFNICHWEESVLMTNNVARFLYQPFKQNMRYTRLFILVQKLLIVFTAVFVIRVPSVNPTGIAIYCAVGIHFVVFVILAFYRPFLRNFENYVAIFMQIALVIAAVLSVLIFFQVNMPNWLYITIIALNFALPVFSLIVGIVLEWTGRQSQEEEDKKQTEEAVEAELKKEEEEKEKAAKEEAEKKSAAELALAQQAQLATQIAEIAMAMEQAEYHNQQQQVYYPVAVVTTQTAAVPSQQPSTTVDNEDKTAYNNNNNNGFTEHDDHTALQMNESTTSPKITPNMMGDENDPSPSSNQHQFSPRSNNNDEVATNVNPLAGRASQQNHCEEDHNYDENNEDYSDEDEYNRTNPASVMNRTYDNNKNNSNRNNNNNQTQLSRTTQSNASQRNPGSSSEYPDYYYGSATTTFSTTNRSSDNNNNNNNNNDDEMKPQDSMKARARQELAEDQLYGEYESPEQRKKRRLLRMRRRREEIERKLLQKKQVQKEMVEKRRNTVDNEVDGAVKAHLNQTVMFGGVMYIIALCFCVVGLLSPEAQSLTAFGDKTRQNNLDYELVGYDSWQNFTRSCCCTSMSSSANTTSLVVEKWVCENGRIKERLRSKKLSVLDGVTANDTASGQTEFEFDGYTIRQLCSPVFTAGCSPIIATDQSTIGMYCFKTVPNVTGYAMRNLW